MKKVRSKSKLCAFKL